MLKVFKAVADCGGMAAAELELNVGTSTISRQIKDLETRLGLTLCRRGRAGFALTVEGQRIYEETMRLLSAVDAFRSGVDDIHQRMGGRLEIGLFDKTATNPRPASAKPSPASSSARRRWRCRSRSAPSTPSSGS